MQNKLHTLKRIAQAFNDARITWALGASMLLYLKGLTSTAHDIDLMVHCDDVATAHSLLSALGQLQPQRPSAQFPTSTFLEYRIDDTEVDVMAGFAIVEHGKLHDCALTAEQIVEYLSLDGVAIPLQSLRLWQQYYRWMGRDEKAHMIERHLLRFSAPSEATL